MGALVRPFTGFVPTSELGDRVVGPAKSLLAPEFATAGVDDDLSFRHRVGRSVGPDSDDAMAWMAAAVEAGGLRPVEGAVIVHALERDGQSAIGVLADVSVDAYGKGRVKPHEKTIAATEQKMVGYMLLTRLFGNPVVLAHRSTAPISDALAGYSSGEPEVDFVARDRTRHRMWFVDGDDGVALAALFADDLYIADGHHRLEAARELARAENRSDAWFPAGIYAEDQFDVWAFARGVREAGLTGDSLVDRLADEFDVVESTSPLPRPDRAQQFGVRVGERSFVLSVPDALAGGDVHDRLDVNLLQRLILEPLLGIEDPRRDLRLDVIADAGDDAHDPSLYDAWFLPYPTAAGVVMEIADMGRTMPPKSTFFLPKLPGGIMVRPIDE